MIKRKQGKGHTKGLKRVARHLSGKESNSKAWSLSRADKEFRKFMLGEAPKMYGKVICAYPGCPVTDPKKLTVSHYFGRVRKATRFNIENCDLLCRPHHYWDKQRGWEFAKQTFDKHGFVGRYTLYMIERLGAPGFSQLKRLSEQKMSSKKAIALFQDSLTIV